MSASVLLMSNVEALTLKEVDRLKREVLNTSQYYSIIQYLLYVLS